MRDECVVGGRCPGLQVGEATEAGHAEVLHGVFDVVDGVVDGLEIGGLVGGELGVVVVGLGVDGLDGPGAVGQERDGALDDDHEVGVGGFEAGLGGVGPLQVGVDAALALLHHGHGAGHVEGAERVEGVAPLVDLGDLVDELCDGATHAAVSWWCARRAARWERRMALRRELKGRGAKVVPGPSPAARTASAAAVQRSLWPSAVRGAW